LGVPAVQSSAVGSESGVFMQSFFGKKNVLGFAVAIVLLIVGFWMLGLKPADNYLALNVAPFVLLFAFLVVIPWSIWTSTSKKND
jgi:membrane protease YdiL (CAAX protease family)